MRQFLATTKVPEFPRQHGIIEREVIEMVRVVVYFKGLDLRWCLRRGRSSMSDSQQRWGGQKIEGGQNT